MEELYKNLEFKRPEFVENPYGIKIYLGTKGERDWCIEVPKELVRKRCNGYKYNYNYVVYLTSEEEVLRMAREFTQLAREFQRI